MLPIALALLLLPRSLSAAPTATSTGKEASPTPSGVRFCNLSSYGRCSNWNPFQCRVTEIITRTVIQHYTSTVYVAVETGIGNPTVIFHHDAQTHVSEHSIEYTGLESVTKGPHTYGSLIGVYTSMLADMTTVSYHDPDCDNCVYLLPRTSSDGPVSIWDTRSYQKEYPTGVVSAWHKKHKGHDNEGRPTGRVSIWEGAEIMAVQTAQPHHEHEDSRDNMEVPSWNSRPQCFRRSEYTYTATFDDLHAPHIPEPYNGLMFSEHFSVFEPSLIYANYTAPSPPFAAQAYPSSKSARITSLTPFNLISMYVGCEYSQSCQIRIRGWSPYRIHPAAELKVRVTQDNENWTFIKFSNYGFNEITLLEFDVLDLNTGENGSLGVTLDEIRFNKEAFEMEDCFE